MTTTQQQQQQPLGPNDFISLAAIGVNGSKRDTYTQVFNGLGQPLDDKGNPVEGPGLVLQHAVAAAASAPVFPEQDYRNAMASGNVEEAQRLASAFAAAVQAAKSSGSYVSQQRSLLDAVCQHLEAVRGWSTQDGDHFVYSPDNFAMSERTLENGARFISVSQQAKFGAR